MKIYKIGSEILSINSIREIINNDLKLSLSSKVKNQIRDCRKYLDKKIHESNEPIYGINTGFGSLYDKKVDDANLGELQKNLVLSHACGVGDEVPFEIVRLILLLKIQSLSYGHSGVQLVTVERLVDMYNNRILPIIYQQGSLGASGDLAPLAHMSLSLLGEGKVDVLENPNKSIYKRKKVSKVFSDLDWNAIKLQSKEGLALLNGTQFMSSYGVWSLIKAKKLSYLADLISSISIEAFDCRNEFYDKLIQNVRPHKGQLKTANNIKDFLKGSENRNKRKEHVQDPYSFR